MPQNTTIYIEPQALRDVAQYVRDRNARLETMLDEVRAKIVRLCDGAWQSAAGEEIQRKIVAFGNNHFKPYKEVVESYAKFLDHTAESYSETEQTLQSSAAAFQE